MQKQMQAEIINRIRQEQDIQGLLQDYDFDDRPFTSAPVVVGDIVHQVGDIGHCIVAATAQGLLPWRLALHNEAGCEEVKKRLGRAQLCLYRLASCFDVDLLEAAIEEMVVLEKRFGLLARQDRAVRAAEAEDAAMFAAPPRPEPRLQ